MFNNIHKPARMALLGAALLALTACEDAKNSPLTNQAFIAQTKTNGNTAQKITVEDNGLTEASFNVRLSDPARNECAFSLVLDQAALDKYNKDHFTNYKILPQDGYTLSSKEVSIAMGESLSPAINVKINPFSAEQKAGSDKFALPFRLVSKDGKESVLNSGATIVYLLDKVVRQATPIYNNENVIQFNLKENLELTQWTVEYCVNADKLGTKVGEMNNQQLFCGWGGDGGEIFSRFGDAPIEGNRMNVKTQGQQLNSNLKFETNKWYHIAIVCSGTTLKLYINGSLDSSVPLPGLVTKITKDNVWFGNSDERYTWLKANIKISEFRLWTSALSQTQIANNMYSVDPASPGLYAYFKFNEGRGDTFADATGSGNTAKVDGYGKIRWAQNERIDGKK